VSGVDAVAAVQLRRNLLRSQQLGYVVVLRAGTEQLRRSGVHVTVGASQQIHLAQNLDNARSRPAFST
jgi:hypothetical protein